MELVIFVGFPGAGKSYFYRENFFDTHIRINLDMLKTRHREQVLFEACLKGKQSVVIDNTNLTVQHRARYIVPAAARGFVSRAYFFDRSAADCLENNNMRTGKSKVPDVAIFSAVKKLEIPRLEEGFSEIIVIK